MAKDKKSALIYVDWITIFEELDDNEAGQLIKHFMRYINDLHPDPPSRLIKLVFEPMKQSLKRDLIKYESIRNKRVEAGLASAEARKQNQQVLTSVEVVEQTPTKPTVIVSVSDSVIDSVKEKDIYIESGHLSITWIEMNKLIDEFGKIKADEYVRKVLNYRKNSNYKSLYLTALNWLKRDVIKEPEHRIPKLAI